MIVDAERLRDFAAHVREMSTFAFDTEFIGEVAYRPKTCLIQLATRERVALVDPLAVRDVSLVWELVGDPALVTIVHAGASDLSPVRRHLRGDPANIIDVQVAAGFVGVAYPSSLAKLVEQFTGHPLAKGHTFTDWDARPLSASQLRYAADDVRYLPLLWETLRANLESRGRISWAQQETMARIVDPHVFDARTQMLRAARGYDLDADQERLLEALCVTRDEIARREDLPHRTTIPDGSLLDIVRERPETKPALDAIRGLPRPVVARYGDELLATLASHPSARVKWFAVRRRREDDATVKARIDAMLLAAQSACAGLEIAPSLAVTRGDLERFARSVLNANGNGEFRMGGSAPRLFAEHDWRRAAFGDAIENAGGM
ncbi:MAG: HRDC domain-containing protein [Phycisphaerales bacterium]